MSAPTANHPASGVFSPTRARIQQRTLRTDRWWLSPLRIDLGFAAFVIYATVRAFQQNYFFVPQYHYLTPFYSPCLSKGCGEAGDIWPQILPDVWWLPYAALSLPFLLLFRLTCYYYRGAYYRTVWQSPTACGVAEPRVHYTGETRFPLIVQNTHRYFFYIAGIISIINTYDAIVAFHSDHGPGGFGFGSGQPHSARQRHHAVDLHAVMPFMPARHRRAAQELLQTPCAVLVVDPGKSPQHTAQIVCVDHTRHADAHRLLRRAGVQRHHFRPEIYWLRSRFRITE